MKEDDRDIRKPDSSDFNDQAICHLEMLQTVHEEELKENEDQDDVVQMEIETDFENNVHDRVLLPREQAPPTQDETAVT